jgi:oxygen-independent coproporphyrinogen III oxidase
MSGVYISYPFCAQKCTYCNFASGVFPRDLERDYLTALTAEAAATIPGWTPETLYLGGGTPSRLEPEDLAPVLAAGPAEWIEATIEAAPGSLIPAKAEGWRRLGLNRVSLGVQSFVTRELARTGRKHTAETVAAEVALLARAGITNVNIDLIAGLPGQTPASWRESLGWIARLEPTHVSVYMLEVDEDSRLGRELLTGGARYGAADTPSDEAIAEMYETAVERLAALGLERYEISNFARPGFESRHNLKYWRLEPYLGLGADAHSYDGRVRWQNVESASEYVARSRQGQPLRQPPEPARPAEERFFVGLRLTEGIEPAPEDWLRYRDPIERFRSLGLLETAGSRLRLTSRGILLSNEVLQAFVGPVTQPAP